MARLGTMTLTGASGAEYQFNIYSSDASWSEGIDCVYYISDRREKPDGGFSHTSIYVGETQDLKDRLENHHKQDCFDRRNYNAISVHRDGGSAQRLEIEADLVEALKPSCND